MGRKTERVEKYLERTDKVMKEILKNPRCSIGDIARNRNLRYKTVSKIVNRYVEANILEKKRSEEERRKLEIKHKHEEEVKRGTRLCTQ